MPPNDVISVETKTERQMLVLILRHGKSSFFLNLLASAGLALGALGQWQGGLIHPLAWLIGVTLINTPPHVMAIPYVKTMAFVDDGAAYQAIRGIQYWGTILMGAGWSAGIVLYGPSGGIEFRLFLAALLSGMCAGAISRLNGEKPYYQWFLGLLVVPLITINLIKGTHLDYLISIAAVLYVYAMLENARNHNEALRTALKLGFERLSLLAASREALAQAEQASKVKSQFLANMSHEIRTPINAILGIAQVMLRGEVSPAQARQLRRIDVAAEHLAGVINDILDLSKIEAGKLQLEVTAFDPGQLIRDTLELFADAAERKGVLLQGQWEEHFGHHYQGDPTRLRQMLGNLVSNAIKFSHGGEIRVLAKEVEIEADAAMLRFEVSDQGIGIPEEKQRLLFQPFSQADSSTTRKFGGTGLGLSIVRNLAEMMDGAVGVVSKPGEGASFWFTVRVGFLRDRVEQCSVVRTTPAQVPPPPPAAAVGHILVVDDNATNRKVVAALLKKGGHRVDCVDNGREADEFYRRQAPDLILMDCQMPVMDGFEATRRIRRWENVQSWRRTPIIAFTAGVFSQDRQNCVDAGMDDFLPKPVNAAALQEMLCRWLPAHEICD